jgi:hypothetical protein
MSTQIQRRRGTTAEHSTFTGVEGELTVDTTKDTAVVHDGTTVGGHPLQKQYPPLGSAAAPTYTFTGDPNTGIYSPGANQVAVATNGVGRLFVDASGHVGINTSAPTNSFTSTIFKSTSGSAPVHIYNDTAYWGLFDNGGTTGGYAPGNGFAGHATNNYLNLFTAGSERLRIDSSGKVGVGVTENGSNAKLEVRSTTGSINSATLRVNGGLTTTGAANTGSTLLFAGNIGTGERDFASVFAGKENGTSGNNDSYLAFGTRANGGSVSERLRITSAGLVGIGTSAPSNKLDVVGVTQVYDSRGTSGYDSLKFIGGSAADFPTIEAVSATSPLHFKTNSNVRMAITSTGLVGIGTTSAQARLHVKSGVTNYTGGLFLEASANDSGTFLWHDGTKTVLESSYISSGSYTPIAFHTSNSGARIDTSGRLLVGTSSARGQLGITPGVQSEGTNFAQGTLALTVNSNSGAYPLISLARSGGTSLGSNTIVSNGDIVGKIFFTAADGVDMASAVATIEAVIDGTPGSDDLPGRLVFSTTADGASSPTERMRIASDGNVNVGGGGITARVSAASAATSTVVFYGYANTASYTTSVIQAQSETSAGTGWNLYIGYASGGNLVYRVYGNGNVQNTSNSYTAISDIKLKENIVDANSQWDDIKGLQVRNYNLKEGQTHTANWPDCPRG